jgi:hypothetical protein
VFGHMVSHGCGTHVFTQLCEFTVAHNCKGLVVVKANATCSCMKRWHSLKTGSQGSADCSDATRRSTRHEGRHTDEECKPSLLWWERTENYCGKAKKCGRV